MKIIPFAHKVLSLMAAIAVSGIQYASAEGTGCRTSPAGTSDGPAAMQSWVQLTAMMVNVYAGGGDWLARMTKQWDSPTCKFEDGRPVMAVLLIGYKQAF